MVGKRPRYYLAHFLVASMTTTEATTREPRPEATGIIAAPTPTDHSTAYPGGGASKPIMAVAIPTFQTSSMLQPDQKLSERPKDSRIR